MTQVVAINQERTRKAWSDEPHDKISVIWTADNERIEVDEMAYWKLREQADPVADYHDGDYIGFDRPIEWADVLPSRNPY